MWLDQFEEYQNVIELSDDEGAASSVQRHRSHACIGEPNRESPRRSPARRRLRRISEVEASAASPAVGSASASKRSRTEPTPLRTCHRTALRHASPHPSDDESCEFSFEEDDECEDFIPRGASRRKVSFDVEPAAPSDRRSGIQLPRSLQNILPNGDLSAPRELDAADCLTEAQTRAVSLVAREAQPRSKAAAASLAKRLKEWGYPDNALQQVLDYIRHEAPIIVHIDLTSRIDLLQKDTHYRNQFETKSTRGSSDLEKRSSWEDRLFQNAYQSALAADRVKYGVLNAVNDPNGIATVAAQYGLDYLVLKCVRLRTTFSDKDSCNKGELASCEWYAHVLDKYSNLELRAVVEVALGERLYVDSSILDTAAGGYKEVQIHGQLLFAKHIEAVVVHPSRRGDPAEQKIRDWCTKLGISFQWMPNRGEAAKPDPSINKQESKSDDKEEALPTVAPESSLWRWRPQLTDDLPWLRFDAFSSATLESHLAHIRQHGTLREDNSPLALPLGILDGVELTEDQGRASVVVDGEPVALTLKRCTAGAAAYERAIASKNGSMKERLRMKGGHWEWCAAASGVGNWQPYDAASCATLETALLERHKEAKLHIGNSVYVVDLDLMVQANTQSNYKRLVRRLHALSKKK